MTLPQISRYNIIVEMVQKDTCKTLVEKVSKILVQKDTKTIETYKIQLETI